MNRQRYFCEMYRQDKRFRRAVWLAVVLPLCLLAGGCMVGTHPDFFGHLFPPCSFKVITGGYNCLSCGATRATLALLRGDLLTAIYYNPLYVLFLGWLVYLYVRLIISLLRKPYQAYCLHLTVPAGIAAAVIAVLFLIVRNMSFYQTIFY